MVTPAPKVEQQLDLDIEVIIRGAVEKLTVAKFAALETRLNAFQTNTIESLNKLLAAQAETNRRVQWSLVRGRHRGCQDRNGLRGGARKHQSRGQPNGA